jgi:hypothetical protein
VAFCGYDNAVARPSLDGFADDGFRSIGRRRVQQIDAEIEGFLHQGHRLAFAEPGAKPDAAIAAATEPGHAHLQLRLPKRGIVHGL